MVLFTLATVLIDAAISNADKPFIKSDSRIMSAQPRTEQRNLHFFLFRIVNSDAVSFKQRPIWISEECLSNTTYIWKRLKTQNETSASTVGSFESLYSLYSMGEVMQNSSLLQAVPYNQIRTKKSPDIYRLKYQFLICWPYFTHIHIFQNGLKHVTVVLTW